MDKKNKIGLAVGFCAFIGLGIWAIADPTASESWTAMGRKAWLKEIIISIWGVPFGIALIVMGALALVGLFCTDAGDNMDFS